MEIDLLVNHREFIPLLASWFEEEWPDYFSGKDHPGALEDLEACCHSDILPLALVAFVKETVLGTVSLKESSLLNKDYLSPWISALLVAPSERHKGIGKLLVRSAMDQGQALGFSTLYAASERVRNLFTRYGWTFHDLCLMNNKETIIYRYVIRESSQQGSPGVTSGL